MRCMEVKESRENFLFGKNIPLVALGESFNEELFKNCLMLTHNKNQLL